MTSWNYVVTAHKPTNVTHSLVGNFTSPTDLNLIVSKCTRIEVHKVNQDGLHCMMDFPLYGRIATMELWRPAGQRQDMMCASVAFIPSLLHTPHLYLPRLYTPCACLSFLSTERYQFCILAYDEKTQEIVTRVPPADPPHQPANLSAQTPLCSGCASQHAGASPPTCSALALTRRLPARRPRATLPTALAARPMPARLQLWTLSAALSGCICTTVSSRYLLVRLPYPFPSPPWHTGQVRTGPPHVHR